MPFRYFVTSGSMAPVAGGRGCKLDALDERSRSEEKEERGGGGGGGDGRGGGGGGRRQQYGNIRE